MAISLASYLVPKNGNTWFLLEDKYFKGGLQVVSNLMQRDAINVVNRKAGMLVVTQEDNKVWQLALDLITWIEFKTGGAAAVQAVRKTTVFVAPQVMPGEYLDFALPLGKSVLIHSLSVDKLCQVKAYETPDRLDTNPYNFISALDHLVDDGSTLMSDGTVLRGRRYSVLTNQEVVSSIDIYFRITNTGAVVTDITLTLIHLTLE